MEKSTEESAGENCILTQEGLLHAMEEKVARGESVIQSEDALLYMNALLEDLANSVTPPWDSLRALAAYIYITKHENGDLAITNNKELCLLMRLGYHGAFPSDSQHIIEHMVFYGAFMPWHKLILLLGATAGLIPLTTEETVQRDTVRSYLEEYISWEEPPEDIIDTSSPKSINSWERMEVKLDAKIQGMTMHMGSAVRSLLNIGKSGFPTYGEWDREGSFMGLPYQHVNKGNWLSPGGIRANLFSGTSSWAVMFVLTQLKTNEQLQLEMGNFLKDTEGFSTQDLVMLSNLSDLLRNEGQYSKEYPLHSALRDHFEHLTWDHLLALATLVRDYNAEWALAAMEW